jgi:hypothetical protein
MESGCSYVWPVSCKKLQIGTDQGESRISGQEAGGLGFSPAPTTLSCQPQLSPSHQLRSVRAAKGLALSPRSCQKIP